MVDRTTGQKPRRLGTRAGDGPDHAARKIALSSRHAPANSTRWNGETSRASPCPGPNSPCQTASPATATMASASPTSPTRYPAGTARSDQAPRRWSRVRIQPAVATSPAYSTPGQGVRTGPGPPPTGLPRLQPSRYSPSTSSNEHQPVTRSSYRLTRRPTGASARCRGAGSAERARWAAVAAATRPWGRHRSRPGRCRPPRTGGPRRARCRTRRRPTGRAWPPPVLPCQAPARCSSDRSRPRAATCSDPSAHHARACPARPTQVAHPAGAAWRDPRVARTRSLCPARVARRAGA